MMYDLSFPEKIYNGKGYFDKIADIAGEFGYKNVLIISDPAMVNVGNVARLTGILDTAGLSYDVYTDTVPEPTIASIIGAKQLAEKNHYDAIVALGGGSVIDSAKAVSIWAKYGGQMRDYKMPTITTQLGIPVVAIPTTGGTGAEATKFTIITDETNNEKMLCVGHGFMPTIAIIDYTLSLTCPPRVTADSAIDALSHAVESYVSRRANPFSDMFALEAMGKIFPNLRTVYNDPNNEQARQDMMSGALLGGMCINNASVALIHGMSRPIGAFFHVPHGMSNAMLFPAVTKFSVASATDRYADCARACGITDSPDDKTASGMFIDALYAIKADLEVPTLKEFGADEKLFFDSLDTMAEQALASGSPGNNPIVPSKEEIIELYHQVWD